MNTRHAPSLELCQEFDRLCKEKKIVVPETEHVWQKYSDKHEWSLWTPLQRGKTVPESFQEIQAPLVSELGEWLKKLYGSQFECAYCSVMDLIPIQVYNGKYLMAYNLMIDPDTAMGMTNYLIAEGIITKL